MIIVGGKLFAFGFNADCRLGQAEDTLAVKEPTQVAAISGFYVDLEVGPVDDSSDTKASSSVANEFQCAVGA